MVSGRTLALTLLLTSPSFGQSVSIDAEKTAPALAPTPPPAPKAPKPAPVVVMPKAITTPLEYPEGAQGEAKVLLELTLESDGRVRDAIAVEGEEPFRARAIEAAKAWRFEPATRDGKPIAAKIRFLVQFVPPRDVPEAPETPPPATAESTKKPEGAAKPAPKPSEPVYEIVVLGERPPIRHELGRAEIARMPGAFGDAFRAIEALPGVVPIVSGLPYFYVRGAPPGNVGYYFDGIPVPYLYHFAAGPSVIHPAFVDRVDLYPGAYPVRYGRYAGAIVSGEMAPPGYRFRGEWNVRIIDSGAMVEAPFANGRGSIMAGGRISYTGLVLSLIVPDVNVGYWDYQTRVRYELSAHDTVEVFGFGSGDYTTYKENDYRQDANGNFAPVKVKHTAVDVGFHRLDLRWDHRLDKGNWRNALMLGRDRTGVADGQIDVFDYMIGGRSEYVRQVDPDVRFRAGADALFESLRQDFRGDNSVNNEAVAPTTSPGMMPIPGMTPTPIQQPVQPIDQQSSQQRDAAALGFYGRNDFSMGVWSDVVWRVAPRVLITPGLRSDLFVSGNQARVRADPRITAEFQLSKTLKVTHGLALVHQTPSFVAPVPGFKPSLKGGLQKAVQHSVGLNADLPLAFAGSASLFQSAFFNMTDAISLIQLQQTAKQAMNQNADQNDLIDFRSNGHAYGFELMLRRSLSRRLGGFLSYTLSRSTRFTGKLSGPATTDRTHVLNVAGSYDLGKDWRFGARFLLYTGIPAQVAYLEAARHPPRTPAFWRVDFKLEKRWYLKRPERWWGLTLEVLNTTLNKEYLTGSCNAFSCKFQGLGPVTVPSIGVEGAF